MTSRGDSKRRREKKKKKKRKKEQIYIHLIDKSDQIVVHFTTSPSNTIWWSHRKPVKEELSLELSVEASIPPVNISLAGAAISISFVATKVLSRQIFVATNIILSRQ